LHHYECIALLVANSLQSGRFRARSTASVQDSPWESRSRIGTIKTKRFQITI